MNFLKILSIFILSVLILTNISCSEKTEIKKSIPVPEKTIQSEKSVFVDPTKSMSNAELNEFDSLFNILYSNKLNAWKTKQENNLNCEIVFHTARDGHALCINFINFTDTSVLNMNLDTIIESISDNEFEQIEKTSKC